MKTIKVSRAAMERAAKFVRIQAKMVEVMEGEFEDGTAIADEAAEFAAFVDAIRAVHTFGNGEAKIEVVA